MFGLFSKKPRLDDATKIKLEVILCAEKAAPPGGLCGYRLNGGELVGGQNLRVRRQRFDLVETAAAAK